MVTDAEIQRLAELIAATYKPRRIVLFGSRATGAQREDSDVDLLVELAFDGSPTAKAIDILKLTNPKFPIDLLVRTPEDIAARYTFGDPLIRHALDAGTVLYEAAA